MDKIPSNAVAVSQETKKPWENDPETQNLFHQQQKLITQADLIAQKITMSPPENKVVPTRKGDMELFYSMSFSY